VLALVKMLMSKTAFHAPCISIAQRNDTPRC
jgi:hypothetical protein